APDTDNLTALSNTFQSPWSLRTPSHSAHHLSITLIQAPGLSHHSLDCVTTRKQGTVLPCSRTSYDPGPACRRETLQSRDDCATQRVDDWTSCEHLILYYSQRARGLLAIQYPARSGPLSIKFVGLWFGGQSVGTSLAHSALLMHRLFYLHGIPVAESRLCGFLKRKRLDIQLYGLPAPTHLPLGLAWPTRD
ncbi:unnamed protein product, partial [Rhizoctonia solani]